MSDGGISASIIIEWYNATRATRSRAHQALTQLAAQIEEIVRDPARFSFSLTRPIELIFTYNSDVLQHDQVSKTVFGSLPTERSFEVKLAPVPKGTYCLQKNHGSAMSSGQIVIFLDSDAVPEPSWLAAILTAFLDSRISAAIGNTYVDYSEGGAYSKALALTWMFPLRSKADGIERTQAFYANNCAFRRQVFLDRPFEDVPGFIHAAAGQFVSRLEHEGIVLWSIGNARASHPPPNGLSHFVKRAVACGRARALSPAASGTGTLCASFVSDLRTAAYHTKILLRDGRTVRLTWWETPVAIVVSVSYDFLIFAGFVMSKLFRRQMINHFNL